MGANNERHPLVGEQIVQPGAVGVQQNIYGAVRPMRPVLAWQPLPEQPELFALLMWRSRLGPMVGRQTEKAALANWATRGPDVRVRLLTGEGGAGKSRLAAEVADELKVLGWSTGFVDVNDDARELLDRQSQPSLLLVDYPEQSSARVAELLQALTRCDAPARAVRVLLLSRMPVERWQPLVDDAGAAGICDEQAVEVRSLAVEEMDLLCRAVWARLGTNYGISAPAVDEQRMRGWLEQLPALHGRPLFVTAAALHAALAPQQAFMLAGGQVVQALVRRELKQLRGTSKGHGLHEHALSRLAALASAVGGLGVAQLERLADPVHKLQLPPPEAIVDVLSQLPWWNQRRFAAPSPDIVAAALLHEVLAARPELAPDWLWAVLHDQAESRERAQELAIRLDRMGYDIRTVVGPNEQRFDGWLAEMVDRKLERARQFRHFSTQAVHDGALQLSIATNRTLTADACLSDAERAAALDNLGERLSAVGDREGACGATRQALLIYRRLARVEPTVFAAQLANTLNNLGVRLSDLGDGEEALEATREALRILWRLAEAEAGVFLPEVAMVLNNLGNRLSVLGAHEDALAPTQQALHIYRRLADTDPDTFLPHLAKSLNNLGYRLNCLDRHAEAVAATQEALRIRRRLVEARPDAFLPDLAGALNNLSVRLSDLGDHAQALDLAQEALGIYRSLAQTRPDAFRPHLAQTLNNLGILLCDAGNQERALETTFEAVGIHRQLAEAHPSAFLAPLANGLSTLERVLKARGDHTGALEAAREALVLRQRLAQAEPRRSSTGADPT